MEKKIQGLTLIEILVSLVILSVGLLAVLKMQIYAVQAANSAFDLSIAVMRLDSLRTIHLLKPNNFSELLSDWAIENALYLPATKIESKNKIIYLCWYDNFSKKDIKIAIKF